MLTVTLINPDSLDKIEDLRDALSRTNIAMLEAAQEIDDANGELFTALSRLARLAAHRHHGNTDAIMEMLDLLLQEYFGSTASDLMKARQHDAGIPTNSTH